ncbi:MAG: glycosyltransferase [Alphaproteobacteria bacterium]|nr:glycosyltransferase [Alphaproteobacteria bacterium]
MKTTPKVSVLMPIYKTRPEHLKAALESILSQTFKDFEFVILNDSPEETTLKDIVLAYEDPRIRYVENKQNLGVAASYNRLIELAQAPLLAMMNHDDIAFPHRLEKQVAFLSSHQETGLLGTGYKKFGELNRFKNVLNPQNDKTIRSSLLFKSSIHHPTIMFRKNIVTAHNIRYNENYVSLNDRDFYYEMSKHTKLANLNEVLYKYRFHKDMVSKRHRAKIFNEQCLFHDKYFKDNGIELTIDEKFVFDNYAALGRCKIKYPEMLKAVASVLEKIAKANQTGGFMPEPEFSALCARYLLKRCLNAAVFGKINSTALLAQTQMPVTPNHLLNFLNFAYARKGL